MPLPESKYAPIWKKLKLTKVCRVTSPQKYHKTIIKQVKNKRDDDTGFRFELAERNLKHEIKVTIGGTVITFKLKYRSTIYGL